MRPFYLGITLLAVVAVLPAAEPPKANEPTAVASKDGRFKVTFPGATTEQQKVVPIPGTKYKIEYRTTSSRVGGAAYTVTYNDYPTKVGPNVSRLLKAVQDSSVGSGQLIVDDETKFGPDNVPCRDFRYELNGQYFRVRAVIVGQRLFQVMCVGPDEDTLAGERTKLFFKSFGVVTDKKPAR
jgi:hypothetical protein